MKVINQTLLEKVIIERSRSSHKGDYGRLLLLGGTYPYGGAIIMAALAAVKSGAGLVTVGTDRENIPALHSHLPEPMAFSLQDQQLLKEQLEKAEVVLLGPGLRDDASGENLVKQVFVNLSQNQILIVDGGALTILARTSLSFPSSQLILAPHQKEWEKLSGITIEKQKEDATASVLTSFPQGTILVEKGPATRIWEVGQSDYYQLQVGGPYQATGGMGDTLAGMIAGFRPIPTGQSLRACGSSDPSSFSHSPRTISRKLCGLTDGNQQVSSQNNENYLSTREGKQR